MTMTPYGELSAAFYDLDKPCAPSDALAFYRARAVQASGLVLEPMCGSGRFLVPLLQSGIPIEGLDASAAMLAACRQRARALGLAPTLYEQPLEQLDLPRRYSLAFIPAGSLGLIHQPESLRACLRQLNRHLSPSASLIFELDDCDVSAKDSGDFGSKSVTAHDGRSIVYEWRSTRDSENRTIHYDSRYQLREGDSVLAEELEKLVLKLYTSEEMFDELHRAGFADPHVALKSNETSWLRDGGCSLYECTVLVR